MSIILRYELMHQPNIYLEMFIQIPIIDEKYILSRFLKVLRRSS